MCLLLVDNFARLFRRLESDFTIGLLLFFVLLLIKNIIHAFMVLPRVVMGNVHPGTDYTGMGAVLIPEALEFIALGIFLYLSRKY